MNQVVTGEAVAIDLRVARLGSRMIAGLIDLAIQGYALYVTAIAAFLVVQPDNDALTATLFLVIYVGVVLGYPVACETFMRGRTVGKMVLGLRVVRDDGGPIRFRHALTRGLIGAVVERPGLLLGLPAVISMVASSRSKRLGDVFAGTVVLQTNVPRTIGALPTVPPPLAGWVATLDLTGVDDELAVRARRFLARAHELSDDSRERIGGALLREIRAAVTPQPPPDAPGWAVLSAVLAERTRRAYGRLTAGRQPQAAATGHPPGGPAGRSPGGPYLGSAGYPPFPAMPYPSAPHPAAPFPAAPHPPTAVPSPPADPR
ncbi:RDD domain containing protein [Parafrankia sp. EAN1pec]|uniref:RDD family protein n=1 Tax=Parafrankia sp. (strain EAN1pec) TaxID=298653 RepID=UPI000054085B|nr:RDD domain containing protein [Frankia sp. EAN1pec]